MHTFGKSQEMCHDGSKSAQTFTAFVDSVWRTFQHSLYGARWRLASKSKVMLIYYLLHLGRFTACLICKQSKAGVSIQFHISPVYYHVFLSWTVFVKKDENAMSTGSMFCSLLTVHVQMFSSTQFVKIQTLCLN